MTRFSIIVALDKNNVIGDSKKEGMLWAIRDDLKIFKELTMGKIVVVGHRTYKQLPMSVKGSNSGRELVVLSKNPFKVDLIADDSWCCDSLEIVFKGFRGDKDVCIIGGKQVYDQVLNNYIQYIDRIHVSRVDAETNGDLKIDIDRYLDKYQLVSVLEYERSDRNEFPFTYQIWERKFGWT